MPPITAVALTGWHRPGLGEQRARARPGCPRPAELPGGFGECFGAIGRYKYDLEMEASVATPEIGTAVYRSSFGIRASIEFVLWRRRLAVAERPAPPL
jgi:hypothetical protein